MGSRSPSAGRSTKDRRINSNDRDKQLESVQKDKSRSRSGSEKKQSKKTKLKSTDSPQSIKENNKEQTVTSQPDLPQPGDENYQFVELPVMNVSFTFKVKFIVFYEVFQSSKSHLTIRR